MYPAAKLRRIALDQQGLLRTRPYGQGKEATRRAIRQLGYVQIDTISVVERAHHHVLRSRVPNYKPAFLDALLRERKVFEYWYHAAAYLPMEDYRFSLPHMHGMRRGELRWQRSRDKTLMRQVLERVASDGPLRARDFENPREGNSGWWDWKPAKSALEQLFMQGDLMIIGRQGFQKVYDLTERVLPAHIDTSTPSVDELADHLVGNTLRSHGFATAKCITYLRPGAPLRQAVKSHIQTRCEEGTLTRFALDNGERVFGDPGLKDTRAPSAAGRVRILSPFDSAVIQRDRGQAIFDFDYQIECYVPEEKRRFGYFCLPILYRDKLIGRMDCKAHRTPQRDPQRKEGCFEVKALHLEDPALADRPDPDLADKIASAIREFAEFNNCTHVDLQRVAPGAWHKLMDHALSKDIQPEN